MALVPKTWGPIIEASMRSSNMNDLRFWAAKTASMAVQENSPQLVKANAAQQKMHVFQGVSVPDYNLVEMLGRLIALGVVLRPCDVYEHQYGMFDILHYHKEGTSKIMLFELTDYKQVLYMDADGLILQNLDSVFKLNMTPVALLPGNAASPENATFDTRVMLLQPSKALHAQLQFIVENDRHQSDVRILTQFFSSQIQSLPDSLALQTFELRPPNENRTSGNAIMLLQQALYVHLSDSPQFPQHWQWADPSRLAKLLPTCGVTCGERLSWLHVYSLLTSERELLCLKK